MENVFLGCIGWYVINECQSHRIEQRLSDKRGVEQAGQARPMQENPLDDDEMQKVAQSACAAISGCLAGWRRRLRSFFAAHSVDADHLRQDKEPGKTRNQDTRRIFYLGMIGGG